MKTFLETGRPLDTWAGDSQSCASKEKAKEQAA
jgi:hypothetical protein